MGSAMLAGWQKDSQLAAEFHVIEPMLEAAELANPNTYFYNSLSELAEGATLELVVLAVKPQMMAEALADTGGLDLSDCCFISTKLPFLVTNWPDSSFKLVLNANLA